MIVNDSISIQQEESVVTQATMQSRSAIQHFYNEPPNINSARVETAADNNDIHVDASHLARGKDYRCINQKTTFPG